MPCGPPKPRNAVLRRLVASSRCGRSPGCWGSSTRCRCGTGRGPAPARRGRGSSRRPRSRSRPGRRCARSSSKPTRQSAWNPCRLPDMVRSCVRFSRSRTGRPVSVAPSAAIAAKPCGCISLPPKPPPIRRHCTVTSWLCQPEHVRHDLLRLGRVLGAALDEDLLALVDMGQGAVRLEVEVLLAGELELAAEDVGGGGEAGLDVAPLAPAAARPGTRSAAIASVHLDEDGSGSTSTSTAAAPSRAASSVSPSTQHTAWP